MTETGQPGEGWWLASDGNWYPLRSLNQSCGVLSLRLLLSVLLLALAGCGTDSGIGGDGTVVSGDVGDRLGIEMSPFQAAILADGVVTSGEYEKAVFAAVECLRAKGLLVHEPRWEDGDRRISYEIESSFSVNATQEEQEAIRDAVNDASFDCSSEYEAFVAEKWQNQEIPNEDERLQLTGGFVACLADAGIDDLAANPSYEDILELLDKEVEGVDACTEAFSRLFIIPTGSS
jgi:hypothetical protein